MIEPLVWTGREVKLLDQTRLPNKTVYLRVADHRQMWRAIRRLQVRGAPAIGIAAAFGVYLGVRRVDDPQKFPRRLEQVCRYLAGSRPTAVNLFWALDRMRQVAQRPASLRTMKRNLLNECLKILRQDQQMCRAIGRHALRLLKKLPAPVGIQTHCNAGGLATSGYGTALAPLFLGKERGLRFHVYVDETRPLLQGSRITAYELKRSGIPATLICDNMAASVIKAGKVRAVIVGADRIAANGDVANKIGTLGLAIMARHFGIPFYVCAPSSTVDLAIASGKQIPIEERAAGEVARPFGRRIAPAGVAVYNPAFDVTPADLVTAIITEKGVARSPYRRSLRKCAGL